MDDGGRPAVRRRFVIEGVVQGVGFRPHVHRVATERGLSGHVGNDSTSVFVEIEGSQADVAWFSEHVVSDAPPLSCIESVMVEEIPVVESDGFEIVASREASGARTLVPPDTSVCEDCLSELFDPADHRHRYPFITCTNCGPRFTIIRRLPYDRPNTTMASFELCEFCAGQYSDPADRRFHAQPLGCADCGPRLAYERSSVSHGVLAGDGRHKAEPGASDSVIATVQGDLADGAIVAIKGIGGYHLACDATNDDAVRRLRERKGRVDKPFAVMVPDLTTACSIADMDAAEASALESVARPIVLVRATGRLLSSSVAPRNPRVGLVLPYTPLHHLLFRPLSEGGDQVPSMLVMTSGNRSNEPLAHDDDDARRRLAALADSFCTHDRPIHVPCDDSVVRIVEGDVMPIRRSRGYAPLPVALPLPVRPTLAVGGELKNTFCLADGTRAWMSQHIGDMENIETLEAFERSVELFTDMYTIEPDLVAADAHPGYLTHRWAGDRVDDPSLVQHHHAHVCALMAEAGLDGEEPVIGVAFDGTGYGTDGAIWGGEILIADYEAAERFAALEYVPLPGGDGAIRKPYRVGLAHLWAAGIAWSEELPSVAACDPTERRAIESMLVNETHTVPTSSMGRLFDAVSSLLGVRHEVTYEGQAAIELEHLAATAGSSGEPLRFTVDDGWVGMGNLMRSLVDRLRDGVPTETLAAAFHDAVAVMIHDVAASARSERGLGTVGLTGGVFQNAHLVSATRRLLEADGFSVLTHHLVPPNDGGLALGQAVIAGRRGVGSLVAPAPIGDTPSPTIRT